MASRMFVSKQSYFQSPTALISNNPNTVYIYIFFEPITINKIEKNIVELDSNKKTSIYCISVIFI